MNPSDDFRRAESPPRLAQRRDLNLDGRPTEASGGRDQLPDLVNGGALSVRPDWAANATSALEREKRRRDHELSPDSLTIPIAIRNRLLRQAWAGGGVAERSPVPRRAPAGKWLIPAAACLLAALAVLALRNDTERRVLVAKTSSPTLPIQDRVWEPSLSGPFSDNLALEESLLARLGASARKDAEVSFTKLVVVDRMVLEPRVILSSRFRMAIGLDLSAVEADGS